MHQIVYGGKEYRMDDRDFFTTINRLAAGYQILGKSYYNLHVSGFADWKGTLQMSDIGQNEFVKVISDDISDKSLAKAFNLLRRHLETMKELDRQIVDWLALYVGLSSIEEKKAKSQLNQRLKHVIIHGPDGLPQGPIWAMHPEYQVFVKQSQKMLSVINEDQLQISQRIQFLTKSTGNS